MWKNPIVSLFLRLALFLIIFGDVALTQDILTNYSQTYNSLSLDVELKSVNCQLITDTYGNKVVKFENFQDESQPGQFALPKKDLFIALPAYSRVKVNLVVKVKEKIQGIPSVNPYVSLYTDSSLKYTEARYLEDLDFSKPVHNQQNVSNNLFEVKGYLWIRDYYCLHIGVNQYRYNNSDFIEFLKSIHLDINILEPRNNEHLNESMQGDHYQDVLSSVILNFKDAAKLDKRKYSASSHGYISEHIKWIDFNKNYLKLGTASDGVYRLNKSDIEKFGINTAEIDPNTFKIYCRGIEIPIYIRGASDNSFDEEDFIEFFGRRNWGDNYRQISRTGESYKEYLNRYSDTTIYWLAWDGAPGIRMDSISIFHQSVSDTLEYYSEIAHYEEDRWLDYSIDNTVRRQEPYWKENQTWVWAQQYVGTVSRDFMVSDVFPGKTARAFYKVQSFGSNIFANAHRIGLSINSYPAVYDSAALNKYEQKVIKASFSSDLLRNGSNILKTISFPTQNTNNSIEYDWYEVEYPRFLNAINNKLCFQIDSSFSKALRILKIQNITSDKTVIYKFNDNLKRITSFVQNGTTVFFTDSVKGGDKYYLTSEDSITVPKIYYKKQFTDLASSSIQADYILLTASGFINKANEYAMFIKQNYQVETRIINVLDIYDQYNYGFFAPEPIRDFLVEAFANWNTPKPSYLFLVGDASYDYYGNKAKYDKLPLVRNFVPSFGEPVSDTWFVIWDSTGAYIPQMFTGRLPAGSIEDFTHYFQKHKDYFESPFDEFNKRYLFFSGGNGDNQSELSQLKKVNDNIISELVNKPPIGGIANHLFKTFNPRTNYGPYSPDQVSSMIRSGGVFISYLGHSGTQIWDNGISDVEQLNNVNNKGFLVTDFGCSTGKFAEPDVKAFSELFVAGTKGGAIGYIGNSSLGFINTSIVFPQIFYNELLRNNNSQLGNAHVAAKLKLLNTYGSTGVYKVFVLTNTLFGDPVLKLKIPAKPDLYISIGSVKIQDQNPDENMDSVKLLINYFNYGRVDSLSFKVSVTDNFNGHQVFQSNFLRRVPMFKDSLSLMIPVKKLAGAHSLQIQLDPDNSINEFNENNNLAGFNFVVSSNQLRTLVINKIENRHDGLVYFLNPSYCSKDSLALQYDVNPQFTSPRTIIKNLDSLITKIFLTDLVKGRRYWLRFKLLPSASEYNDLYSFIYEENLPAFYISDSVSLLNAKIQSIIKSDSAFKLGQKVFKLSVSSAGFYDGNYAIVDVNGNNFLPEGHLDGIHCAVFDEQSLQFLYSKSFNYWADPKFSTNFLNFLDTLKSDKILAMANSGGAGEFGMTQQISQSIKSYGSKLIDSVKYRHSWAIIGKKGALPGSVPEKWSKPNEGSVKVDSVFAFNENKGSLLTGEFGPVGKWKRLVADYSLTSGNSKLDFLPIGISGNNQKDTLKIQENGKGTFDLSVIDPDKYKKLQMLVSFSKEIGFMSPELKSLSVEYDKCPELMTNYQTVRISKDTVQRGERVDLSFSVFNAGETIADSFKVKVEVQNPDNSNELIYESFVHSLAPEGRKYFDLSYNTSQSSGSRIFSITIDPDNKITELFKDNNYFSIPFFIKPDTTRPSLKVTFDGNDIFDGEFVSPKPDIKIELSDKSFLPVTDTSAIQLVLNNKAISYSSSKDVKINFNSSNPKVVLNYKPTLANGEYTLNVIGKNGAGNFADSAGISKTFQVSSDIKLIDLYNYPNPFRNETYFTFKLTQIPDEFKIKIYTVSGRMIKEIIKNPNELKFDFNKIYWDGRDQDGDLLANGVYLYKILMTKGDKTENYLQKIAIIR